LSSAGPTSLRGRPCLFATGHASCTACGADETCVAPHRIIPDGRIIAAPRGSRRVRKTRHPAGDRRNAPAYCALRAKPSRPEQGFLLGRLAHCRWYQGRFEEGRELAREAIQVGRHLQPFASYIVNSVALGDLSEANDAARRLLEFDPLIPDVRGQRDFPDPVSPTARKISQRSAHCGFAGIASCRSAE